MSVAIERSAVAASAVAFADPAACATARHLDRPRCDQAVVAALSSRGRRFGGAVVVAGAACPEGEHGDHGHGYEA